MYFLLLEPEKYTLIALNLIAEQPDMFSSNLYQMVKEQTVKGNSHHQQKKQFF